MNSVRFFCVFFKYMEFGGESGGGVKENNWKGKGMNLINIHSMHLCSSQTINKKL